MDRKPRGLYCLLHTFGKHLHIFPCFEVLFTTVHKFLLGRPYIKLKSYSPQRDQNSVVVYSCLTENTSSHRFTLFLKCIYLRYIIY